ncbi:MAG: GDSL-type esterase/lipase family protein [Acidimicrobiales bacterium]|jgi:lysophospholipase L1-like esterase|nr:GDSL-type esterase/lipase family protein [Acidimicrobiales bacterium]
MTDQTTRREGKSRDGRVARRILTLGILGIAWLAFDAHLGSRRVSRAREANLRARVRSIHRSNPILPGETVFLGDSITFDGDWEAAFSDLGARNRGIGWDTTADVLERLDESLDGPPATVVLMIGTNDLFINVPHAQTVRNMAHILDHTNEVAPDTRIIVQSVLPRTDRYQPLVAPLNEALSRICNERELEFIDHTEHFSGADGLLHPALHDDGIHPNGEGHRILVDALRPLLHRT